MTKRSPIKKERLKRIAGQALREKILDESLEAMIPHLMFPLSVAFGILIGIFTGFLSVWLQWIAFAGFLTWGMIGIWRFLRMKRQIENDVIGRDGERAVGQMLDDCKRMGWRILHDFQTDAVGNIDHIVIAPQGIFTIETKTLCKNEADEKIIYDGRSIITSLGRRLDAVGTNPLDEAEREARFLKKILNELISKNLPVDPTPIVTFPCWYVQLELKDKHPKVMVMNTQHIVTNIPTWPVLVSAEEQTVIYDVLCHAQREMATRIRRT